MTLTQAEAGFPPPIEHVDVPKYVKEEKGIDFEKPSTPNYPWDKARSWRNSEFLKQRINQLRPYMNELDPFRPVSDVSSLSSSLLRQILKTKLP
jgi:hypothetical protein